jgi:hypothetical protein
MRYLFFILAILAATPIRAQQEAPLAPGDRLRIVAHDRAYVGRLIERDSASLLLGSRYDRTTRLSLASIDRVQRSRGSQRRTVTVLSALAGFAVSTFAVVASEPGNWRCGGEFCGLGLGLGIIGGATVGIGVAGYATYEEPWTEVDTRRAGRDVPP